MWLLRTSTAKLVHCDSPYDVKGGYAILSHVWQEHEQSFNDIQALRSQLATTGFKCSLRVRVSAKIRECCTLAKTHGYDWLWIDTCCIDRSSSAELSEAVNSMYEWYALSQVCYAYLQDVPSADDPHAPDSTFRRSKWFTRSWTLQELIAPRCVVFLGQDWTVLGTKARLAPLLQDITGIDTDILTFRQELGNVSVARRMSWASCRNATRVEDEAYSLMGLFGVHMPTIYGEGRRAFRRLQEEILKRTSDQTLFAWGNVLPIRTAPFRERLAYGSYHPDNHMFAPSPAAFNQSAAMVPVPMEAAVENAMRTLGIQQLPRTSQSAHAWSMHQPGDVPSSIPLPDFTVTSHGIRSLLLVIQGSVDESSIAIAILACKDNSTGSYVGLLLRRRLDIQAKLQYPRYHIGITVRGAHEWMRLRFRLSQVEWARHTLSFNASGITVSWQQLYISHRPPSRSPVPRLQKGTNFRFYFPRWLEVELGRQGFRPDVALPTSRTAGPKLTQNGAMATYTFTHQVVRDAFRIHVGYCGGAPWATAAFVGMGRRGSVAASKRTALPAPRSHIMVAPSTVTPQNTSVVCECGPDDVRLWPDGSRVFGDSRRNVQLTFTRAYGGSTHLLDVRVGGSVYHSSSARTTRRLINSIARPISRLLF
ncbi:HET-domain-containing protein [Pilatotrama ljubarskyi]|nr:HET-domain-containing protein [Pilatotrama ljubarskyi]